MSSNNENLSLWSYLGRASVQSSVILGFCSLTYPINICESSAKPCLFCQKAERVLDLGEKVNSLWHTFSWFLSDCVERDSWFGTNNVMFSPHLQKMRKILTGARKLELINFVCSIPILFLFFPYEYMEGLTQQLTLGTVPVIVVQLQKMGIPFSGNGESSLYNPKRKWSFALSALGLHVSKHWVSWWINFDLHLLHLTDFCNLQAKYVLFCIYFVPLFQPKLCM